jgi:hypothetical protein
MSKPPKTAHNAHSGKDNKPGQQSQSAPKPGQHQPAGQSQAR